MLILSLSLALVGQRCKPATGDDAQRHAARQQCADDLSRHHRGVGTAVRIAHTAPHRSCSIKAGRARCLGRRRRSPAYKAAMQARRALCLQQGLVPRAAYCKAREQGTVPCQPALRSAGRAVPRLRPCLSSIGIGSVPWPVPCQIAPAARVCHAWVCAFRAILTSTVICYRPHPS